MQILRIAILAALFSTFAGFGVQAGSLRIALLAETEVQSDSILLANLLPAGAPPQWRSAAEKIALGASPQIGAARMFSRSALASAIRTGGLPVSSFAIPEIVTVRRGGRLLTRDEVFSAIQSALKKNPSAGFPALQLQDMALEADVRVPTGDAQLEVTQLTFDQFIGRARFRLWPKSAPGVLPFFVTARLPASSSVSSESGTTLTAAYFSSPLGTTITSPILVEAGRLARLHLHSASSNMLLEVRPLQRGRLGEVIRVRLPANGRTLRARVVGAGYLDAIF